MYEFDAYTLEEIGLVLRNLSDSQGVKLTEGAARELASKCSGVPGGAATIVKRMLRECPDLLTGPVDELKSSQILERLGYDGHYPKSLALHDALVGMSGIDFEHWIAALFKRQGFSVNHTGATGDHGIDLVLSQHNQVTGVQCKRWSDPVGEPVLRDFYGALISSGFSSGIIVTTSCL